MNAYTNNFASELTRRKNFFGQDDGAMCCLEVFFIQRLVVNQFQCSVNKTLETSARLAVNLNV